MNTSRQKKIIGDGVLRWAITLIVFVAVLQKCPFPLENSHSSQIKNKGTAEPREMWALFVSLPASIVYEIVLV